MKLDEDEEEKGGTYEEAEWEYEQEYGKVKDPRKAHLERKPKKNYWS